MVAKVRHACERCGLEAVFERANRLRDEDYYEVFHELMDAQARVRTYAREVRRLVQRVWELEHGVSWRDFELALRVAELKAAGVEPLNTNPDIEFATDELEEENPFA